MDVTKESIKQFYLEFGREQKSLSVTRTISSIWWGILTYKKCLDQLEKMEELVNIYAKKEWDESTNCEFDRENKKIIVKSINKNRKREIIFNLVGKAELC